MQIVVNGESREVSTASIAAVLAELGYGKAVVVTALNGEFVAVAARARTDLRAGDRLEVLAPNQGG